MPNLTGSPHIFSGDTTVVDTSATAALLQRARDASGNEYIYLKGTASTAIGDFVAILSTGESMRTLQANSGPLAVACAAVTANTSYGWYQIYGVTPATTNIATDANADGKPLYVSSTAGRATTTITGSDSIVGAIGVGAAASNAGKAFLNYPFAMNGSYL